MHWTQVTDPYEVYEETPAESYCVGRTYFFRNIGSEIWVAETDIPNEIRQKLWLRINSGDLKEVYDLT